jgi:NAD(P)H-nitrite reductase large subunit
MNTIQLQGVPFSEDVRKAPETETICYCSGVTKADILRAMGAGARCLADIKAATGACTQGRCRETSPRGR